jgi:hypothetical protein
VTDSAENSGPKELQPGSNRSNSETDRSTPKPTLSGSSDIGTPKLNPRAILAGTASAFGLGLLSAWVLLYFCIIPSSFSLAGSEFGINLNKCVAPCPTATPCPPCKLPDVALVGMSYMVDDWDPRRIDLTRAGESGIPVSAGDLLEFVDIAVSVREDSPDYVAHIEVYQDSQLKDLVGRSESFPLTKGIKTLEAIEATQFNRRVSDHLIWEVPPDWIGNALHVALAIYRRG